MMIDVYNFYYRVGGDETQVYSTKTDTYVPVDDAAYQDWLALHPLGPNNAADEADLREINMRLRGVSKP
jgi:hypothetical protein